MFSASPRIVVPSSTSYSVTFEAPSFWTLKVVGPAASDSLAGSQPASVILTATSLCGEEDVVVPLDFESEPQPARANGAPSASAASVASLKPLAPRGAAPWNRGAHEALASGPATGRTRASERRRRRRRAPRAGSGAAAGRACR